VRAAVPAIQDLLDRTLYVFVCDTIVRIMLTTRQKALKERGIDQMLEDAKADNKDNDAEYMKPSGR